MTYQPALDPMGGCSHAVEAFSPSTVSSCPVCGDALAPQGERPWSDRNPGKVADVYVWADGGVSVLSQHLVSLSPS